jgi:hypothetical protein
MKDTQSQPPSAKTGLVDTVAALEARIAAIEKHLGLSDSARHAGNAGGTTVSGTAVAPAAPATHHTGLVLASLGQAVLMLAGAFLLRALTEARILDATLGVTLGVAYVLALFVLTQRSAVGDRSRATLFGLAAVLVAYPFVWETTTKLRLLSAPGAAVINGLVTAFGLAIAARHRLQGLVWLVTLAALATCAGLYWAADARVLFAAMVMALGVTTVWLGYLCDWLGPQWLVAAIVNFLVFLTTTATAKLAAEPSGLAHPPLDAVLLLALALPVVYLGSFTLRTLLLRREAGAFEIAQSLMSLMAGHLTAVHLLRATGVGTALLGSVTLAAATAGYAAAFTLIRRRQGRGLNFFYYAWLGLLLTFMGTSLVVAGRWLPYIWGGLGVAFAMAGGHYDRWTLRLHCAAYLIGATVMTGLPAAFFDAFAAPAASTWHRTAIPGVTAWLLAAASYGLLVATQLRREMPAWRRLPRFLLAAIALIGLGSQIVLILTDSMADPSMGLSEAIVAVVRTGVIAATAMTLATVSRSRLFIELSWFVNPLLILGGLKLLIEDLRHGTPFSRFFGFAIFGIALIMAPRLRHRDARAAVR